MADASNDPVWSWPEERWRAMIGRVRAGRPLKPKKWKGGARAAMALSFNLTGEIGAVAGGGGITALSEGHYGARRGLHRLMGLLKQQAIPATVFVPAVAAILYVEEIKAILAGGHELGLHGWIGEESLALSAEAERDLVSGARDALEKIAGLKPVGIRAPGWSFSDNSAAVARGLGLLYDSSLMADDEPYDLTAGGEATGLIEIPVSRQRDDSTFFAPGSGAPAAPEAVFDIFRRELEMAYEEGGLFQLTLHPHLVGVRSRIWIVEELLKIARTLPGLWCATHADVALWCKGRAGG